MIPTDRYRAFESEIVFETPGRDSPCCFPSLVSTALPDPPFPSIPIYVKN